MRPKDERRGDKETGGPGDRETGGHGESTSAEVAADGAYPGTDLTDEEALVLKLLKEKSPVDLNELKGKAGLSNKKWDTGIKGLRAMGLAKEEKNEEGLFVSLI